MNLLLILEALDEYGGRPELIASILKNLENTQVSFFRLAPGKTVGLLNFPAPVTATRFTADNTGRVTHIYAAANLGASKARAYLYTLGSNVPEGSEEVEIRVHNDPWISSALTNRLLSKVIYLVRQLSSESEVVCKTALVEVGLDEVCSKSPWPREAVE